MIFNRLNSNKYQILNNSLIKDSFWAVFGNLFGKGISLFAGMYIARILGKEIFGEYSLIKSTVISFSMLSTFGLGYTSTKFIAERITNSPDSVVAIVKKVLKITLIFSGSLSILVLLLSDNIANYIFETPHLTVPLKFVSIWILFNALTTSQIGILAGLSKFQSLAKINVITGITLFILSIVFTLQYALVGAILALLISQVLNFFANYYVINSTIKRFSKNEVFNLVSGYELIRFSLPVTLQELMYGFAMWFSSILVVKYSDYSQLGMYNAATQIGYMILYVPGILRNVILNHFSKHYSEPNYQIKLLKHISYFNFFITSIPVAIVCLFSSDITRFYGVSFSGLESLIIISAVTTIFSSVGNVFSQYYLAIGKNWIIFILRLYRDIIGLLCFYIILIFMEVKNTANTLLILNLFFQLSFLIISIVYIYIYKKKEFKS